MSFNFRTQLKAGQMGEVLFLQANKGHITRTDGYQYDFIVTNGGGGLELKTDFYSLEGTPNFFMERWSVKEDKKPGGPWQALDKGATQFVYFYIPSLTYYTFDTTELVGRLETLIKDIAPFPVKNSGYTTEGYRVPRAALEDIATVTKLKVVKK